MHINFDLGIRLDWTGKRFILDSVPIAGFFVFDGVEWVFIHLYHRYIWKGFEYFDHPHGDSNE